MEKMKILKGGTYTHTLIPIIRLVIDVDKKYVYGIQINSEFDGGFKSPLDYFEDNYTQDTSIPLRIFKTLNPPTKWQSFSNMVRARIAEVRMPALHTVMEGLIVSVVVVSVVGVVGILIQAALK